MSDLPYELVDGAGTVRLRGPIVPGPGAVIVTPFVETPGAGVYTASFPVVAGGVLLGASVFGLVPWDADAAVFALGHLGDPGAFIAGAAAGYDASAAGGAIPYDPTAGGLGAGFDTDGSLAANSQPSSPTEYHAIVLSEGINGRPFAAASAIVATVTATGAGGSSGRLLLVLWGAGIGQGEVKKG